MNNTKKPLGRPRKENKEGYTAIMIPKSQRTKLDEYMFTNRLKLSYSKLIEHLFDELLDKKEQLQNLKKALTSINEG